MHSVIIILEIRHKNIERARKQKTAFSANFGNNQKPIGSAGNLMRWQRPLNATLLIRAGGLRARFQFKALRGAD